MANILVTGGAGFIGGNFVRYWNESHPNDFIVVLDALRYSGNRSTLEGAGAFELILGDIRDTKLVLRLLRDRKISSIVNFAAETHVDRSISEPDPFIETNISGTHSLLKAAKIAWLDDRSGLPHRFHQISTDEVFGSLCSDSPPATESRCYAPSSPYSASKAAADHLVRAYRQTFGLQVSTTICSNNYGPYQFPEKLIPFFVVRALHGSPLNIFGDGMNVRDWLHVEDHCRGIDACLTRGRVGEVYNIGSGEGMTNLEVSEMICAEIDRAFSEDPGLAKRFPNAPPARGRECRTLTRFIDDRLGHDRRYALDCSKAQTQLEYRPHRVFTEGLRDTVSWYLRRQDWWAPLIPRY